MKSDALFDVVGVGLGPANLGLAVALDEAATVGASPRAVFLDRRPAFDWHPEMLLPSSVMQVSYLKDLATQRNPSSPYTFVSYLHAKGRLNDFINLQSFFPTRLEFTDYLSWVVERLGVDLLWGTDVRRLDLTPEGHVRVTGTRDGEPFEVLARGVVLGVGSRPSLPAWAQPGTGGRVVHNIALRSGLANSGIADVRAPRIAVVGQGQSAAEVLRHVLDTYPQAQAHCFLSGYGMVPADDSPFANRVFDPAAVDDFYFAPPAVRDELLLRHRTTNYGCVDPDLISWLFETEYTGKVTGQQRLHFRRATTVETAVETSGHVELTFTERLADLRRTERFDAVVCATGFSSPLPTHLLGDGFGAPDGIGLGRDYRMMSDGRPLPVYVVGATASDHGLSAGLLSNIAVRSGEVLASLGIAVPGARLPAAAPDRTWRTEPGQTDPVALHPAQLV